MARWLVYDQPGSGCLSFKIILNANLVQSDKTENCTKENTIQSYPNTKRNKRVPLRALNAGPSEPKLGNVTTGLQGETMRWLGNLTLPICTCDVIVLTASVIHLWKMCYERNDRPNGD